MSFPLPSVDLSTAIVGTSNRISLQNVGISAGGVSNNPSLLDKPATLFFFNDSGCGLQIVFSQGGAGFNLPAGAWVPVPLPPGENSIKWTVVYVLPSPPVSLLLLTYYAPGEPIPQSMTLGNSPVGIGGSVQTSSVQTLSNEGNAAGGLVLDVGDVTISQLWKIFTDHFAVSVDQSGVAHTVLKGNTSGNPLQLGQAGDIAEVLGKLTVDQLVTAVLGLAVTGGTTTDTLNCTGASTLAGVITSNNGISIVEGAATSDIFNDAADAGRLRINVPSAAKVYVNGVSTFHIDSNGIGIGSGKIFTLASSFSRISFVTFTSVNGTTAAINHNLGATPAVIVGNAYSTGVNASNVTLGFSEIGATTFKCTSIAAVNVVAICMAN